MRHLLRRTWAWVLRIADAYDAHFGGLMAAAISFYALLSVVPLLSVGLAVFGWVLGDSRDALARMQQLLASYLPTSGSVIYETLAEVKRDRGIVGLVGLAGLLLSGSAIFTNLEMAFNNIWGVTRMRGWVRQRLWAMGTTVLTLVLLLLSVGATSALTWLENRQQPGSLFAQEHFPVLWSLGANTATFLVSTLMFTLVYRIVPNKAILWREAIAGGIFAGAAWEIAKYLFALYMSRFGNYNKVYGSLGSAIILVVWTYYSSMILLIGAEIAADGGPRPHSDGTALADLPHQSQGEA